MASPPDRVGIPPIERQSFIAKLESLIAESNGLESATGLILVDLVNLRQINYRHSFSLGDAVIREAGTTLQSLAVENCAFRLGGHTFAVIIPKLENPAFLVMAVTRVRQAIEDALYTDSNFTSVKIAIGLSVTSAHAPGALSLLANAEMHLSEVRDSGELDLDSILNSSVEVAAADQLERPFEEALRNNEFTLYYQPQVSLHTGQVVGAEALLRWQCGEHGFVPPERIVGLASETGRLFELTKSLAHIAARQLAKWRSAGIDIPLALNVPAELVSQPDLPTMLQSALQIWGAPASAMTVEITEQAVVEDIESESPILAGINDAGFRISIDDFGTGYSSLSYFRSIPATELKVDRSFVSRMLSSDQDRELIRIIIEIAHLFDMHVVAEGVEDLASLAALKQIGCDVIQGFYVARPMPAEDFMRWMTDWNGLGSFIASSDDDLALVNEVLAANAAAGSALPRAEA